MMLFRRTRRADPAGSDPALERGSEPDRADPQLTAIASVSSALVRAKDKQAVARTLMETCFSLLGIDFAAVALVSEDARSATGLLALTADGEVDWWTDVTLDFDSEPSGIASAVFEGGPVVIYDVTSSKQVNPRLA